MSEGNIVFKRSDIKVLRYCATTRSLGCYFSWVDLTLGLAVEIPESIESTGPMIGENRQLVTNKPVELETAGKLQIILEEFIQYTPISLRKPEDVSI